MTMPTQHRKRFWAMLGDIAEQVEWEVNGQPAYLDKESWRLIVCCGFMKETRTAKGIDGGYVVLGLRLRDIFTGLDDHTKRELAGELLEFVGAFGAEHGVVWSKEETEAA